MKTNVYVAGASSEVDRAAAVMAKLEELGYAIAYDWPTDVKAHIANPVPIPILKKQFIASKMLQTVRDCDVFILLVPEPGNHSIGCWIEYQEAVRSKRDITVVLNKKGYDSFAFMMTEYTRLILDGDKSIPFALDAARLGPKR